MSDRLREIAERDRICAAMESRGTVLSQAQQDRVWLSINIDRALAYCDRILATNPNGAELMFLGRVKAILTGTDDGTTVREGSDG